MPGDSAVFRSLFLSKLAQLCADAEISPEEMAEDLFDALYADSDVESLSSVEVVDAPEALGGKLQEP